jgi:hypothetical protein
VEEEEDEPSSTKDTPKKKRKRKRIKKKPVTLGAKTNQDGEFEFEFEEDFHGKKGDEGEAEGEHQQALGDDESDPFTSNSLAVTKGKQKKGGLIVGTPFPIPGLTTTKGKSKSVPATPEPRALKQTFLVPSLDPSLDSPSSSYRDRQSGIGSPTPSYLTSPYLTATTTTTTTTNTTTDSASGSANSPEKKKAKRRGRSRAARTRAKLAFAKGDEQEQEPLPDDVLGLVHSRSTPTLKDAEIKQEEDSDAIQITVENVKEVRRVDIDTGGDVKKGVDNGQLVDNERKLGQRLNQDEAARRLKQAQEELKHLKETNEKLAKQTADKAKAKGAGKQKEEVLVDSASRRLMELAAVLAKKFPQDKMGLAWVYKKMKKVGAVRYQEMLAMSETREGELSREKWWEEEPDPRGRNPRREEPLIHVFVDQCGTPTLPLVIMLTCYNFLARISLLGF